MNNIYIVNINNTNDYILIFEETVDYDKDNPYHYTILTPPLLGESFNSYISFKEDINHNLKVIEL